ncbi:MAG: pseudouridine synthase [Candidatus Accumulibacter phosphatis]|nr:pseudouridine synthase [Candidatus Accumulibacter phosphatis]
MPRPTLKLPKTTATDSAAQPGRWPGRKPVRGGAPPSKRASTRRADSQPAAAEAPPPRARKEDGAAPRPPRRADEARRNQGQRSTVQNAVAKREISLPAQQPAQPDSPATDQPSAASEAPGSSEGHPRRAGKERFAAPRATADRPGKPAKKAYPPRGIARSTGARAFRPAPENPADGDAEATPASAPHRGPPSEARPGPRATPQREAVHEASGQTRGLAKESPRLSKLVSQLAQCSRREADEWIENGWVSVDGVVVNRLGARVNPKAKIKIKDIASAHTSESVSIVFNKPRDLPGPPAEAGREAIAALIRADNRWSDDPTPLTFQASHLRGLAQAGKLEADEGGMLAFTQEGSVARRLSGGDSRLEKEYHVRVEGELAADGLDLLRHGLSLDNVKLPRAQVSWLSDQQMRFVLLAGKKGQIQRMCELVGLQVTDIKRVRIGSVSLGKLPPGQWRYLREDERF